MKTFEQFINESKEEDFENKIIKFAHIFDLNIKFDFLFEIRVYANSIFYFYDNDYMFTYIKKNNDFYVREDFDDLIKSDLLYDDTNELLVPIINKYFKINIDEIYYDDRDERTEPVYLDVYFKNNK